MKKKTLFTITLIALGTLLIGACSPLESVTARMPSEETTTDISPASVAQVSTNGNQNRGNNGNTGNNGTTIQQQDCDCNQTFVAAGELTQTEIDSLIFMREEEKLARDVYLTLYDQWGLAIFQNIASSEQMHTDSVKNLLELYGISDPVIDETIGVFVNSDLQTLYNQLVTQGSASLVDAFKVGATIEEIDILDLQESLAVTADPNITLVYGNLLNGSYNHLRAFVSQIEGQTGESYVPQYMTLDAYTAIISTASGRGNGGQGGGQGNRGNH